MMFLDPNGLFLSFTKPSKSVLFSSNINENPRIPSGQLVSINGSKNGLSIHGQRRRERRRPSGIFSLERVGRLARLQRARRPASHLPRGGCRSARTSPLLYSLFLSMFNNCIVGSNGVPLDLCKGKLQHSGTRSRNQTKETHQSKKFTAYTAWPMKYVHT